MAPVINPPMSAASGVKNRTYKQNGRRRMRVAHVTAEQIVLDNCRAETIIRRNQPRHPFKLRIN